MKEITVPAKLEELNRVIELVNRELEAHDCSMKTQTQIDIAVEEIYVNIARYAYPARVGEAAIRCCVEGDPRMAVIRFEDAGIPYNPLERDYPDTSLSAEEREPGGLGIYMVKKIMDDVIYDYVDGKNILTIRKNIEEAKS